MPYQVALLNFEGPLDLLLQLIERSDLEITEVSLSQVTTQYLAYTKQLPQLQPRELNQFLELAARLVYLKSLALLPQQPARETDDEVADLTAALEQYRSYQMAAQHIGTLIRGERSSWTRTATTTFPPHKLPLPNITSTMLKRCFADALASLPETTHPNRTAGTTLAEMTVKINSWLTTHHPSALLSEFLSTLQTRSELVVAFIAILELIKAATISVSQDGMFGDIMVSARNAVN